MKPCPTCGREIAKTASLCESCEVWAAALVESRPAAEAAESVPVDQLVESEPEPIAVAPPPSPAAGAPGRPRRGLVIGAAAAVVVVLLAVGMRAARGPSVDASAAPAVTPAAPPTTPVRPPGAPVAAAKATPSPASASVPTASAPTASAPKWSTAKQRLWLGDRRRGAAFELPADNVVKTWFGPNRPSLVVRCVARKIDAFVFTGSPMKIETRAAGKTVNLAMDDEPMRTERWPDSDDHDALFAPEPVDFTRRLLTARTLRFSYSPHNSSDVVAEFSVAGLDAFLTAASRECGQ